MMQADNRLLTNLIKCEKEHHSALLALLVRSHTSLAALSAYASTAAPPVAQALLGCIQAFAAADEGLRGYAAALEGWKEELKEVKRVEDEVKNVMRDKEILVGRLIKASKQKIPTSSLQAGPAPIPNASYLTPASPSSSSFSLPNPSQPYAGYTPTPQPTQHINSKLALAQRELHACEAHLAGKEAELAEVRRSAMTEGMARRCRAMADVGHMWRERGEQGLNALDQLGRDNAGAPPPPPPHTYNPPRRSASYSSHSGSSLTPSHSASQYLPRATSPFGLPRSTSPFHTGQGTYQSISGGYQHSHPLPALPERDSWHAEERTRPVSYHQGSDDRRYEERERERERRPMSMVLADDHRIPTEERQRPVSSLELRLSEPVALDIPPPHSIGDHEHAEFIPLGRPVSSMGHNAGGGSGGSGQNSRWGDDSSSDGEGPNYQVVENEHWNRSGHDGPGEVEVDPEILRAVEKMGMVPPPKPRAPPTPPATASPTSSPNNLPDLRVIEATPQKGERERKKKKKKDGSLLTDKGRGVREGLPPPPAPIPVPGAPKLVPTPTGTSTASAPMPGARPISVVAAPPNPTSTARVASPAPALAPARVASPPAITPSAATTTSTAPAPEPVHHVASPSVSTPQEVFEDATMTLGAPDDVSVAGSKKDKGADDGTMSPRGLDRDHDLDLDRARSPGLDPDRARSPTLQPISSPRLESIPSAQIESSRGPELETGHGPGLPAPTDDNDEEDELSSDFDTETAPTVAVLDTPRAKTVPVLGDNTPKASAKQIGLETPKAAPMATLASPVATSTPRPAAPIPTPVRVPTPVSNKAKKSQHRITPSTSDPLVRNPTHTRSASKGAMESASETEKKTKKKKKTTATRPTPAREPSAEDRADLAAMLRNSDGPSPHVRFPAPNASVYVPTAPPVPKQTGGMYLPSTGGGGTTRSDVGPARGNHFDIVPPSPVTSSGRGRSGSGSTGFFGRVAGLFGRKKNSGDSFGRDTGAAWKTRIDANITRARTEDSSDDDHIPSNLVTVTNVNTPAGRLGAVDNHAPASPKPGLGRRLTKADRGQTLRVGPPPESSNQTRKASLTERDERFEPAGPGKSKKKGKKTGSQSVDGGGLSRKGSLKSTISEPLESGRTSSEFGGRGGRKRAAGAANLMALVEDPGSSAALAPPPAPGTRRSDSPARSQTPQSLLSVPPARAVSPTSTAAPKPVRATSPMPLKSALRRTPSPMPQGPPPAPVQVASPTLVAPSPVIASASPRNSIAESVYETGEEDFDDASDGGSDVTAAGRVPSPAPATHVVPTSPGTALAAFKSTVAAPLSDTAASVSTAGPYSTNGTQPTRRKSVRINPDPPEMSATPNGTPAMELDEEPKWENKKPSTAGWASRIGRGWEDSSEESGEDEEYERVRKALESSYKHMDAVNGVQGKGREKGRR